ncbi:hypothetical protein SUGI_0701550 [Cryptomeria japonica]|uniref:F-box/kelch-repeat protein At1g26930-like n=1 Tax=Cryptomeria japonica TaxID=3369 RepID=UPI0024149EF2|nr:F-box/kelch-repeat protein At1g26930-like [Cryptomeria japonica]XP_059064395.1 F-box/kelch-repeat protein At1g26930-like [Cryptomeria japonica]GLJ34833.1 hypothetical protein SUGI_0701490 [Cryptomeria japonica]GLJ34835.1 hypothetical protein SUGI_0701550 [Cryptomeria japonica]
MDFLQELPEQIFRDILLRISYESQSKIKQLLKPAKEMMECFKFYQDRIKFGLANKYICFLQRCEVSIYDPIDHSCKPFRTEHEISHSSKIINVNHKIVVLDGHFSLSPKIWIYDLLSSTWKRGADIPTPSDRNKYAWCASPDGSIYIAGGYDTIAGRKLRDAAVYKVDEDKWELLPQMYENVGRYCRGFFIEGMFYVLYRYRTQRFDPNTRVWTTIANMSLPYSYYYDLLYAFGRLIAFTTKGIEEYDWEGSVWREVEPLPQGFTVLHATVWYDRIFLRGYSNFMRPIFYMYKPGAALTERWISIEEPNIFLENYVESIVTIEI